MSYWARILSIPLALAVVLGAASCGPAAVTIGASDGYYYGDRRLPPDYFNYDSYYNGMYNQDYVYYDGYWYYHGYDTPYYNDPYWW